MKFGNRRPGDTIEQKTRRILLPEVCEEEEEEEEEEEVRSCSAENMEAIKMNKEKGWRGFDDWTPEKLAELRSSTMGKILRNCS